MASSSHTPGTTVQEYSIRVPKNSRKTYNVMRFNSTVDVDFTKWSQVQMERENNTKEFGGNEDLPKFGAGSEYGREAKEEARRKKFGYVSRKYRPEDQPWILKVGGKTGKKFKGTREGGVGENAAYYVFTHGPDGSIDAYPLEEWYNFQPTQRYKALTAEEAELEFTRRNKQVNYFSLMLRKRLRGENEEEVEDEEEEEIKATGKSKVNKDLKISEMDDWINSSDSSESDEEKTDQEQDKKETDNKKKKELAAKKKKKKDESEDEAFEESDDGDEEGREVDYISDSSESASGHDDSTKELKGVEEEDALRKLLSSGEDDDEEEEEKEEENEREEEPEEKAKGGLPDLAMEEKAERDRRILKEVHSKRERNNQGVVGNNLVRHPESSTDRDNDHMMNGTKGVKGTFCGGNSQSAILSKVENRKRKASCTITTNTNSCTITSTSTTKMNTLDNFSTAVLTPIPGSGESGVTEQKVLHYLKRKPMTTTELLQKFKSKKTGLTSEQLVNIMTQILKRINPIKETINGKMYLSIKNEVNSKKKPKWFPLNY